MLGAVKTAAGNVASAIAGILGFHSPPAEGPAADSDKWAPNFVRMLASGLRAGIPAVNAALADLLATGGGMGNLTMAHSVSGSFSGPSAVPFAFGGGGVTIVQPVIRCDGHPVYIDGKLASRIIGPHIVDEMWGQSGKRRPV